MDKETNNLGAEAHQMPRKPVVKYCLPPYMLAKPAIGNRAWIVPIDHPRRNLNGEIAQTSLVVHAEDSGNFETLNTKYVLADQKELDLQQQFIVQ